VLYQRSHVSARYKSTQGTLVTGGWVLAQLQARFGEAALPPLQKLKRELKVEHIEGAIAISPALAKEEEDFTDEMEALEPHPTPRSSNHQSCRQRPEPNQNQLVLPQAS